ncbi:MAG TPA: TonB family protein [Candidatus Cybelea sp.]|jgi:TonB family protein|nr:TonB family protein [Candidatus Cybelea sp.]
MATISKDSQVLTAPPETVTAVSAAPVPRHEDTATASRPQPVALEVPVSVNGARTVEGSDKREPFSETTKTVLVLGNGAVIRLASPVSAGQLLFLTNEKTKKEVVCQVIKSKNYKSVSGYVELEFTESVVGFWGMRFPSDRIGTSAPASLPAAKDNAVAPVSAAPMLVNPVVSAAPKIPDVKPAQIHAVPGVPKPQAPMVQNTATPVTPSAKKREVPVIPVPATSSSLASSLASLLGAPEVPLASTSVKPPAALLPSENKQQPSTHAVESSTEELKLQAARLKEQLSSMLFSAAPTAKPAPPRPAVPARDPEVVSSLARQVFEVRKSEPAPLKAASLAKTIPPQMKSSLDTEEVKIPSWLEPLARNAAAPQSTQELVEREKAKHAAEITAREERPAEPLPVATLESAPEVELSGIGSLLPLDEPVITDDRSSAGSGRGVLYGAIAAGVLLAAGGAWYFLHPANAVEGRSAPITTTAGSQTNATPPVTHPAALPASQNSVAAPQPTSGANPTPLSSTPALSAPLTKAPVNSEAAPVTRDNTRGASKTIPAAVTERISRPPAELEPKKPALGEVHLARPTMSRPRNAQEDGAEAPSISSGNSDANAGGLDSGLSTGNGKQPAAPETPLPVGGDVKSAKLISSVSPIYPILAKNQHVSGDVRVDALIDANGRVTTMKVISGPALLHQAAMDALSKWKYQPAALDGKPVPMHLTVTLQFRLQ